MGLLDFFRVKPPIRDMAAVASFVDENAAFRAGIRGEAGKAQQGRRMAGRRRRTPEDRDGRHREPGVVRVRPDPRDLG